MRILFACVIALGFIQPATAAEVRNFFSPKLEGTRIGACLSGGACGKPAADAFCRDQGYDSAVLFQRERAEAARVIDSEKVCEEDCTVFRQVKCYTVKSDLGVAHSVL
jgi:hypothetical protein